LQEPQDRGVLSASLRKRFIFKGSEVYEKIVQLKMTTPDGKQRETDSFPTQDLLRVNQSIPFPKAETNDISVLTDSPQPKTYWAKIKSRDKEISQPFPFWEQLSNYFLILLIIEGE